MATMNNDPDLLGFGPGQTCRILRNSDWVCEVTCTGDGDTIQVPPHYHKEAHEQHMIIEGRLSFTINGKQHWHDKSSGIIDVPRFAVHSISSEKGVRCVVRERTVPIDDHKERFLRSMLAKGSIPTNPIHLMASFWGNDCYVGLPLPHVAISGLQTFLGYYVASLTGHRQLCDKAMENKGHEPVSS